MRIIFFGTPEYVVPILTKIHKSIKGDAQKSAIVAVVTQKPKPAGRKKQLDYSAVDTWAHKRKVPIFFNPSDLIKKSITADLGVCASYGDIIPKPVISNFKFGILNIHPSLLPKYRGASPVQAAIVAGDTETGVSTIKMDEKVDHGPIISQFREDVLPEDTTQTLRNRLFARSAEVLVTLIPAYIQGKITTRAQNHKEATFTKTITKDDAFIPPKYLEAALQGNSSKTKWKIPFIKNYSLVPNAYCLERFIRAMIPWPVSWTFVQLSQKQKAKGQKRLKILSAHLEESKVKGQLSLVLDQVQLEGKNPVSWEQFKAGYPRSSIQD